jgi:hypothetical protein
VVIIREARADDFERVYPFLVEFENPYLKTEHWRQLFIDHTGLQNGHFGWVLVDGDDIVGFVSTILSERTIRGEAVRLCNTSSWIVKPAYRAHNLALHAKVIADQSVTVTQPQPDRAGAQAPGEAWLHLDGQVATDHPSCRHSTHLHGSVRARRRCDLRRLFSKWEA